MGLSTFFGFNIGVNALQAMQQAQDVVGNNIANASTPGYVQETAQLAEQAPFPPIGEAPVLHGQVGQGSVVSDVSRQTSAFVNQQDRTNQGTLQMFQTHSTGLQQIESILNEPSSVSLQNSLDQFFNAWQTLSTDPSNTAARQTVLSQAQMLGQAFGNVTTQLETLQTQTDQVIQGTPGYSVGSGVVSPSGSSVAQTTSPVAIASSMTPSSAAAVLGSQFQLKLSASAPVSGTGTPTYQIQLETAGANPAPIGAPVTVTSAGAAAGKVYTVGDTSKGGASFQVKINNPSTLFTGTLTPGSTYTQVDTLNSVGGQLGELNQYASQIANLNSQIVQVEQNGESPNALLDQRGLLLDKMSSIANISYAPIPSSSGGGGSSSTSSTAAGAISVQVGNTTLVDASGFVPPGLQSSSQLSSGTYPGVNSGSLQGNLSTVADVSTILGQVDTFLNSLANSVNGVQSSGTALNNASSGTNTLPFFNTTTDGQGHVTLSVNPNVQTSDLGNSNQPGDNSLALAMQNLQSASISSLGKGTFDQGVAQIVSSVGTEAGSVNAQVKTAQALTQQSTNLRQSISGVDTNQQAALMVQFQNSYNAAAKFISVYDQMLQSLLNAIP